MNSEGRSTETTESCESASAGVATMCGFCGWPVDVAIERRCSRNKNFNRLTARRSTAARSANHVLAFGVKITTGDKRVRSPLASASKKMAT